MAKSPLTREEFTALTVEVNMLDLAHVVSAAEMLFSTAGEGGRPLPKPPQLTEALKRVNAAAVQTERKAAATALRRKEALKK